MIHDFSGQKIAIRMDFTTASPPSWAPCLRMPGTSVFLAALDFFPAPNFDPSRQLKPCRFARDNFEVGNIDWNLKPALKSSLPLLEFQKGISHHQLEVKRPDHFTSANLPTGMGRTAPREALSSLTCNCLGVRKVLAMCINWLTGAIKAIRP